MAEPVPPVETEHPASHPVLIVGGTVLMVTLVSFLLYSVGGPGGDGGFLAGGQTVNTVGPPSAGACGLASPDDSYSVTVASDPDPPRPEGTTFRLTLRQGGRVVTGAKVCIAADMPSMEHPGLNLVAKEAPGGRYEMAIKFGMGGSWKASVTIAEPGKPVVSVTVPIEVAPVAQD